MLFRWAELIAQLLLPILSCKKNEQPRNMYMMYTRRSTELRYYDPG